MPQVRRRVLAKIALSFFCLSALVFPANIASAALVVNTNTISMKALKSLNETNKKLGSVFERISSGLRINKAGDDAAGLGLSESKDADYISVRQTLNDVQDAIAIIQTAEGSAKEVGAILKRMRELAVESSSETLSSEEVEHLTDEFDTLKSEADERVASFKATEGSDGTLRKQSPLATKAKERFSKQLGNINDTIQEIEIGSYSDEEGEDEDPVLISTEKQIDAVGKSLVAAFTELTKTSERVTRSTDKIMKAAEKKIQKLEQERKKALKVKPKPKR